VPRSNVTSGPGLSRRSVLLGAAVAIAIAGCTDEPVGRPGSAASAPTPDEVLRRELVAAEADLVARYAATRAAHPELADSLAAVEHRHRQHLAAVAASGPIALVRRAAPTPSTEPADPDPPISAEPGTALNALVTAERSAADVRLEDCLRCEDPALAELVAAIAAGEAANAVLLPAAR
jgi:hypothetical protein